MSRTDRGFTLIEVLVGAAVFVTVASAAYGGYVGLFRLANANQARLLAVQLANEQFEIVRNMPYVNVGLTTGIPQGVLPQTQTLSRGGFDFEVTLVIRNIDLEGAGVQASSKLVEVNVACQTCQTGFTPISLTGQVAPANLQSAASGGALVVQVYDSVGAPIQGATVVVESTATSSITNTDVTNNDGVLNIVGVPPGASAYRVTVSKNGYSTARTYPPGGPGNPSPTVSDATVVEGQVTQISLSIDMISSLEIASIDQYCAPVSGFDLDLVGAKEIGVGVPKYSESHVTSGSGILTLSSLEGDTYTLIPTDGTYDAAGITPFSPFTLNPGNIQSIQLVAVSKDGNSLLVSARDSATSLPLSGATVRLYDSFGYDQTKATGQGFFSQTDWSGGAGQSAYVLADRYFGDDNNVDVATSSGSVVLKDAFGSYGPLGRLESSTFDTGTTSNFFSLNWTPLSQPAQAGPSPVYFQFASNPSTTPGGPWTYLGPDGTAGSFYTVPGTAISAANQDRQYARYMMYLSTETATVTPAVSDVSFTYTSGCIPPGQVLFQGLSTGDYTVEVSKAGYTAESLPVTIGSGWQSQTVDLGP